MTEKCGNCGGFFEFPAYREMKFTMTPVCPYCGETLYVKKEENKTSEKCWCGADIHYVSVEYCSICGRTVLECTCRQMETKQS